MTTTPYRNGTIARLGQEHGKGRHGGMLDADRLRFNSVEIATGHMQEFFGAFPAKADAAKLKASLSKIVLVMAFSIAYHFDEFR